MEKVIRRLAGIMVILTLSLGYFVNPYWYLFTVFVGFNLIQSSFTNFCLPEILFRKLGICQVADKPTQ